MDHGKGNSCQLLSEVFEVLTVSPMHCQVDVMHLNLKIVLSRERMRKMLKK